MNLNYERVLHPMLHDVGLHSCDSSWRRSSAIWTRWRSTRRRAGESIPGKAAPRRTDAWPPVGAAGTRSGGRAGAQGGGARTRSGSVFCGGGGESLARSIGENDRGKGVFANLPEVLCVGGYSQNDDEGWRACKCKKDGSRWSTIGWGICGVDEGLHSLHSCSGLHRICSHIIYTSKIHVRCYGCTSP